MKVIAVSYETGERIVIGEPENGLEALKLVKEYRVAFPDEFDYIIRSEIVERRKRV
jgi:hypothetical protein